MRLLRRAAVHGDLLPRAQLLRLDPPRPLPRVPRRRVLVRARRHPRGTRPAGRPRGASSRAASVGSEALRPVRGRAARARRALDARRAARVDARAGAASTRPPPGLGRRDDAVRARTGLPRARHRLLHAHRDVLRVARFLRDRRRPGRRSGVARARRAPRARAIARPKPGRGGGGPADRGGRAGVVYDALLAGGAADAVVKWLVLWSVVASYASSGALFLYCATLDQGAPRAALEKKPLLGAAPRGTTPTSRAPRAPESASRLRARDARRSPARNRAEMSATRTRSERRGRLTRLVPGDDADAEA